MDSKKRQIIIRDAVADDVPQCVALDHSYETAFVWQMTLQNDLASHNIHFREERLPRKMEVDHQADTEQLRLSLDGAHGFIVATSAENAILGYVVIHVGVVPAVANLTLLTVDRPLRHTEIGARLLRAAQQWAQRRGATRIIALAQTKNYPTIALYQQAGYTFCGFNDQYFTNRDIAVFFCLPLR